MSLQAAVGPATGADIQRLFSEGVALHRQNRLPQAMALYERILFIAPDHAGAMHHIGIAAFQAGKHQTAADFLRSALLLAPRVAAVHLDLGNACKALGRHEEALGHYQRAGELDPRLPDLHFNRAAALQALGRANEALAAYDRALRVKPRDSECHNNRAVVLKQLGRFEEALAGFDRALRHAPRFVGVHNNRGNVYREMKQFDLAKRCYERELALGERPDACFNRALVQEELGEHEAALAGYARAIELKPTLVQAYVKRALLLEKMSRFDESLAACRKALVIDAESAEAHIAHGIVLYAMRKAHEARAAFEEALRLEPDNADTWDRCGVVLRDLKEFEQAIACHDKATALAGERAGGCLNKGNVLRDMGESDQAISLYQRALEISPDFANAYVNLGTVYEGLGRRRDARVSYDRAIELDPDFALAHWNRGLIDLQDGNFADGWRGYEWRWKTASLGVYKEKRNFDQPLWTGQEDLSGKTILLWGEQGFGDVLQFCRYATMVAARGASVLLEVRAPLRELMRGVEGVRQVLVNGKPLPDFDYHCPLLSLPLAFGTNAGTIPAPLRYLRADEGKVAQWAQRLGEHAGLRVGVVWSGNPHHVNDHNRSVDFDRFALLLGLSAGSVQFVSLQKEIRPADQEALDACPAVLQTGSVLTDFSDTAAVCELLDLVISVDTSIVHLAGGLGKPVWVMLPENSDWRWLRGGSTCRWYPSARLYRQQAQGEWETMIERIAGDLGVFIAQMAAIKLAA